MLATSLPKYSFNNEPLTSLANALSDLYWLIVSLEATSEITSLTASLNSSLRCALSEWYSLTFSLVSASLLTVLNNSLALVLNDSTLSSTPSILSPV